MRYLAIMVTPVAIATLVRIFLVNRRGSAERGNTAWRDCEDEWSRERSVNWCWELFTSSSGTLLQNSSNAVIALVRDRVCSFLSRPAACHLPQRYF